MTQTPPQRSSLEVLRAKIVEAIPERGGYEFGTNYCEKHEFKTDSRTIVDCPDCTPGSDTIQLADVLRAVEFFRGDEMTEVGDAICITTDGNMWELKGAPVENSWTDYPYGCHWNLALSLDDQPQPVIDFLTTILV